MNTPAPQRPHTPLVIVALGLLGGLMCCSSFLALGSFLAWSDTQQPGLSQGDQDAGAADEEEAARLRFAQALIEALDAQGDRGFTYDPARFTLRQEDAGSTLNLRNLFDEWQLAADEEQPALVLRFAANLHPEPLPDRWADARGRLLPSVRDRVYLEQIALKTPGDGGAQVVHHFETETLVTLLVWDGETSMQLINASRLEDWGVTQEQALAEARRNLAAKEARPFTEVAPGVWESAWGDNYDLSRVLLPELLRALAVKGEPLVFLPQRDHLVVTGSEDPEGQQAAFERVRELLELPRSNSGRGWVLGRGGLTRWQPPPALMELERDARARDANDQKQALEEKYEQEGVDLFVGSLLQTEVDEGPVTYAVWAKGVHTLMPRADYVVFLEAVEGGDPDEVRVVAAARWEDALRKTRKHVTERTDLWPPRYEVDSFPDARTLRAIGLLPAFDHQR